MEKIDINEEKVHEKDKKIKIILRFQFLHV